ncbi:MAG TPA: hypothetical protein VL651_02085 [Bacteroidia bacterium]|nr:hypothetical protein [Bacteroidia bacterium]
MSELLSILFVLTIWFFVPYFLGTLFFKILKKRWKAFANENGAWRYINYFFFLLCALLAWFFEMLVLTGVKMMF